MHGKEDLVICHITSENGLLKSIPNVLLFSQLNKRYDVTILESFSVTDNSCLSRSI